MNNATIGAAVLGGYLLGRTKKAKLALSVGALLAGSKARPAQLGKMLDSPFLSNVTQQVRTELTDASKAAATSVLTAKADSLAGALHERTEGLRERAHGDGERGGTREETQEETSEQEERGERGEQEEKKRESESRPKNPKKKTAAAGRAKSGGTSRSRRQDDG